MDNITPFLCKIFLPHSVFGQTFPLTHSFLLSCLSEFLFYFLFLTCAFMPSLKSTLDFFLNNFLLRGGGIFTVDFTSLHCFDLKRISSRVLGHPPVPFSINEKKCFYIPANPARPLRCCRQGPNPAPPAPVPALALPAPAGSDPCRWLPLWAASKLLEAKTSPYFGGQKLECSGDEGSSLCPGRARAVLVPELVTFSQVLF